MNEHVQAATTEPLFNPLAPEFIRNPYPYYERMRATDPVHLTQHGMYVASRHADITIVLRDKRFGKDYEDRTKRRSCVRQRGHMLCVVVHVQRIDHPDERNEGEHV